MPGRMFLPPRRAPGSRQPASWPADRARPQSRKSLRYELASASSDHPPQRCSSSPPNEPSDREINAQVVDPLCSRRSRRSRRQESLSITPKFQRVNLLTLDGDVAEVERNPRLA